MADQIQQNEVAPLRLPCNQCSHSFDTVFQGRLHCFDKHRTMEFGCPQKSCFHVFSTLADYHIHYSKSHVGSEQNHYKNQRKKIPDHRPNDKKPEKASALQAEELLDILSVTLTGEELEVIKKLYHQALKLKVDVFCAQPIVQKSMIPLNGVLVFLRQRIIPFSDFDLACTVVDSSAILADIAIITAPKLDQGGQEVALYWKASVDLRNNWSCLSKQYTEEYKQCIERMLPSSKAEEFNYGSLYEAIEQLSDFQKHANIRVIKSEVLTGINMEDIKRPDHYKKWIGNYSSKISEASALRTEELFDKLEVSLTGEELEVIEKLYHQAMKVETYCFFSQQIIQQTVIPLSEVLGSLGQRLMCTIESIVNSPAILAETIIRTAPKLDQGGQEVVLSWKVSVDLKRSCGYLDLYTEEYEQCIQRILPCTQGFFQKIVNNGEVIAGVHVLSSCWCGDLIRPVFSSGGLSVLNIHSNEFAYEESIPTVGILRKVESPMDKLHAFKPLSVHNGDSVGDLLCLLANVVIVIGSNASLRKVGSQFGISFVPLFSGLVKKL